MKQNQAEGLSKGHYVVTSKGYGKVHKVEEETISIILGKNLEKFKREEISLKAKFNIILHSEENVEEVELEFDPNCQINDFVAKLREDIPKHHNFIFTKVFFKDKAVQLVESFDGEEEKEKEDESGKKKDEQEKGKKDVEEIKEGGENKSEEKKTEEKIEEAEKKDEGTQEEVKKEQNTEKEEEKPEFDTKVYEKEDDEEISILMQSRLGNTSLISGSEIEIFVMKVSCFNYAQTFDEVIMQSKKLENWSFVSSEDIILYGFGLYGPFPHHMGKCCIDAKVEVCNLATGQVVHMKIFNEDEKEGVKQFYLPEPLFAGRSDSIVFRTQSENEQVYGLLSKSNIIFGIDGIQFRICNHRDNVFASLYYEPAEEESQEDEENEAQGKDAKDAKDAKDGEKIEEN